MAADKKTIIVDSIVFFSLDFNLDHLKALLNGSSALIDIVIDIVDVNDDKLCESVSSAEGLELILPVSDLVNLVSLHRVDIHDVDEGRDFVN